ncbi:MAG: hypothetical protein GX298_03030, partial [Planctomycetes bacterium]|nr:hypothetical protein [Planctomycetota bacterium]
MKRIFSKKTPSAVASEYGAVMEELNTGQTELAPGLRNLYSPQKTTVKTRLRDVVDILASQNVLD